MPKKLVSIVMGSDDSDLPYVKKTCQMLDRFKVGYDVEVLSAHRSPLLLHKFATGVEKKGYKVIIAEAGGAAHLAGVIASLVPIPVIGVPLPTSPLEGIDSLYSTVQMPSGVPVATMAIGDAGAKNAAILAVQILAASDKKMLKKVISYKKNLQGEVLKKNKKIKESL